MSEITIYQYILIIIAIAIYFTPSIVAWRRGHHQRNPIFVINLFFGWTLIGWVACLAWSVSAVAESAIKPVVKVDPPAPPFADQVQRIFEER
jgi:T4 superinfection immunity protein